MPTTPLNGKALALKLSVPPSQAAVWWLSFRGVVSRKCPCFSLTAAIAVSC